jgi:hypothetical protein
MKVEISHLGPLRAAELEIKPLTIFIGENNTGKTWAAYALSAILGPYGWNQYSTAYTLGTTGERFSALDRATEQLLKQGRAKINMVEFAGDSLERYFNDVARLASNFLDNYLKTERVDFRQLKLRVKFDDTKTAVFQRIRADTLEKKLATSPQTGKALLNALKEAGNDSLYFYTEGSGLDELPPRRFRQFVAESVFEVLHRAIYTDVYILPIERAVWVAQSKVLSTPSQKNADEVSTARASGTKISFTWPEVGFLDLLSVALRISPSDRIERAEEIPTISDYIELSKLLETGILRGKVDFSTPEPAPQRELLFRPSQDVALEMQVSSSMVKQLTPLLLYLRQFAEPNDWLIIDEPEMNLHPDAQARLLELLAMLVNAGLNILITTHTPYFVDHLMNLMKAAEHSDPESIKDKFFLKDTRAFISTDKVSVCLFEDGTAKSVLDAEGYIDWDTFANVTDRTENIYFEIGEDNAV